MQSIWQPLSLSINTILYEYLLKKLVTALTLSYKNIIIKQKSYPFPEQIEKCLMSFHLASLYSHPFDHILMIHFTYLMSKCKNLIRKNKNLKRTDGYISHHIGLWSNKFYLLSLKPRICCSFPRCSIVVFSAKRKQKAESNKQLNLLHVILCAAAAVQSLLIFSRSLCVLFSNKLYDLALTCPLDRTKHLDTVHTHFSQQNPATTGTGIHAPTAPATVFQPLVGISHFFFSVVVVVLFLLFTSPVNEIDTWVTAFPNRYEQNELKYNNNKIYRIYI